MSMLYDLMIKIGVDTSEIDESMRKAKDSVSGFGNTAKGVFAGNLLYDGAKKLGSAMWDFGKDSLQTGMNFDKAMSQVQATMLKTNEEMEKSIGSVDTAYGHFEGNLREFAQFLGENTAYSATQAAEALNYMALAGYSTQESMDMLPNVLSLAAAGNFDLAKASDMVTDTQTAFGISAERTTQMVDEMAKTASVSNTSVEQLGDAFLVVGGLARELNGGMVKLHDGTTASVDGVQELEIALGAMANAGIKGSEAGTHMRNMLMKLSGPTSEGTLMLEELGVTVFDTEGKMRSLSDIFGDLSGEFDNMTQQGKIEAIQALFNTRDLASAEALLGSIEGEYVKVGDDIYSIGTAYEKWGDAIYDTNQGFEYIQTSWDDIGESVLNAKDAASDMAGIQLDNLAGDVTLFQSALEGAQVAISDRLSPTLRRFVQGGTSLMSNFATTFKEKGLQGVVDMGIGLIDGLASSISESSSELVPAALNTVLKFSEGLRTNAGKIVDAGLNLIMTLAKAFTSNLPAFIRTVPKIVSNIAGAINDNAPKLIKAGIQIIKMLWQGIVDSFPVLLEEFPNIIRSIFDLWMAVNWLQLGTNLIKFIVNGVKTMAKELPMYMANIGRNALTFLRNLDWVGMGRLLIQLIVSGISALISAIPVLLQTIGMMSLSFFSNIDWVGLGSSVINFIVEGITALITSIPDLLLSIGNTAWDYVHNIDWSGLGNKVINFIVSGLQALFVDIPNKLKSIGNDAWNKFRDIDWKGVGSKVINFIVSGLASIGSNIKDKLKSIGEDAWNAFKNISWSGLGSAIIDGIISGIGSGWSLIQKLKDLAGEALQAAKDKLDINSPSKVFRDVIGKAIPEGIAVGVDNNAYMVDDAIESLAEPSDIELADYDYDISATGNIGKSKQYSDDETWLVESPELIGRVDRLISILEYYLPKKTVLTGADLTNIVSRNINKQVRELKSVW